jgi:tetratricopeptide (TPR) repeat protein
VLLSGICSVRASDGEVDKEKREAQSVVQNEILYLILNLQFELADSLLKVAHKMEVEDMKSGDPEFVYLKNYLEFLDALISGERKRFDAYLENSGDRIQTIRQAEKQYPGALICLSSMHLQSTLLSAYHGENYKAVRHLYHSMRFLRQSEQKENHDERVFLNRGLITMAAGSVPEEYRWFFSLFGMKGGIEEGIGYLREYHASASEARQLEACLILSSVAIMVDPGKLEAAIPVDCIFDSISLYRYTEALSDLSNGNSRAVMASLTDYNQAEGERELLFFNLLLGEALLNSLDSTAGIPLKHFLENYRGAHYRHYGWHKLSWHFALKGDRDNYIRAKQMVIGSGEAYLDADMQALQEARDTMPLNLNLLRSRVLYDGGYYREALDFLQSADSLTLLNQRDSLEYHYRMARLYDRLGNQESAISNYEVVLGSGSGEPLYFAPNSALSLGIIHENAGNYNKALESYRQCIKINKSAYKKSIDHKARLGIRRVEEKIKLK